MNMNMNAGNRKLTKARDVIVFRTGWFDEDLLVNIFGFAGMAIQYRVTYNSWKEDAFNVHTNNGVVQFKRNNHGLYTYKPRESYIKEVEAKNNM